MSEEPSSDNRAARTVTSRDGASVHPTHDPDPLVAARLVAFGSTTWCRNCDHLIADGSNATDVGVQPCPAYPSKPIIVGTVL